MLAAVVSLAAVAGSAVSTSLPHLHHIPAFSHDHSCGHSTASEFPKSFTKASLWSPRSLGHLWLSMEARGLSWDTQPSLSPGMTLSAGIYVWACANAEKWEGSALCSQHYWHLCKQLLRAFERLLRHETSLTIKSQSKDQYGFRRKLLHCTSVPNHSTLTLEQKKLPKAAASALRRAHSSYGSNLCYKLLGFTHVNHGRDVCRSNTRCI